ncbi:hypothetical protein GCM10022286_23340 [Gryllotalpicola daejeonensis]|uniref:DUF2207 domain-containing protein n=1 Tax=Gryllotalpicola daejeonensis TaxID=993087 RepID=A0ABP7ZLL0_9MICO
MIQRWGIRFLLALIVGALVGGGFLAGAAPAQASVDDFTFDSLHTDYRLSRDAQHRANLMVTEKFVARFPQNSINHGIVRAIPSTADGRSLHVKIKGVTDGSGQPVRWQRDDEQTAGFLTIQIGDPDQYVSGAQTYVITYTMRDVIHDAGDAQQFLFDVNGTGWAQPFGTVSATLHVPAELAGSLTGDDSCYRGKAGSTARCTITRTGVTAASGISEGSPAVFTVSGSDLGPHENITMSVGFKPGTFAIPISVARLFAWILLGVAIVVLALAVFVRVRFLGNPKGTGIIVPQYQAYPGIGVLEAAELLDERDRAFPALITELVVSRAATMTRDDRGTKKTKDDLYSLTLLDPTLLDDEDADAAVRLFRASAPGAAVTLDPTDRKVGDRIRKLLEDARKSVRAQGLIKRKRSPLGLGMLALAAPLFLGTVVFFFVGALIGLFAWPQFVILGVVALIALAAGALVLPLERRTEKAVPAYEHLLGIRDYLKLAEADRIRMLQSPSGAETQPVASASAASGTQPGASGDRPSTEQIVKLYEKLLPYAILFDIEKEWREVLGGYWATTPTEVTPTLLPLQNLAFASAFATSNFPGTTSTQSGSHSWSSSGGSFSSGGFSGGGFGGGGGGGW